MKKIILILSIFYIFLLLSCSETNTSNQKKDCNNVFDTLSGGRIIQYSSCKNESGKAERLLNTNEECIYYKYFPEANILYVKHINTGFNCCPDKIKTAFYINGETIIIDESNINGNCKCDCLYDVEYELRGINSRRYNIEIIDPLVPSFTIEIDLKSKISDSICIERNTYPWGI